MEILRRFTLANVLRLWRALSRFVRLVNARGVDGFTRDEYFDLLAAFVLVVGDVFDVVIPVPAAIPSGERMMISGIKETVEPDPQGDHLDEVL